METEVQEHEAGKGKFQSKLAEDLRKYNSLAVRSYQFERKRRGIHQDALAAAIRQNEALKEACLTMVKCLNSHEDREDFAERMCEFFK